VDENYEHNVSSLLQIQNNSPPSNMKSKNNAWHYISTSPYTFIIWCLNKQGVNFTFYNITKNQTEVFIKPSKKNV